MIPCSNCRFGDDGPDPDGCPSDCLEPDLYAYERYYGPDSEIDITPKPKAFSFTLQQALDDAQTRVIDLEKENKRLRATIDSLKLILRETLAKIDGALFFMSTPPRPHNRKKITTTGSNVEDTDDREDTDDNTDNTTTKKD